MKNFYLLLNFVFLFGGCVIKEANIYSKEQLVSNLCNDEIVHKEDFERVGGIDRLYRVVKTYKCGQPHGTWQWFRADGFLEKETEYQNGKKNGWERIYNDKDKKLSVEIHYKDDLKDGVYRAWGFKDGKVQNYLQFEQNYEKGEMVGIQKFYTEGKLRTTLEYNKVNGNIWILIAKDYKNGKVQHERKEFFKR